MSGPNTGKDGAGDAWADEGDWGLAPIDESERGWLIERDVREPRLQSTPNPQVPVPEDAATPSGAVALRRRATDRTGYQPPVVEPDDEIYDDFPPPRRGRGFLAFMIVMCLLAGAALAGLRWYQNQVDPPGPSGAAVKVTIPPSTSTAGIGKILHEQGVIGNPNVFRFYAQYKGKGGFEAGQYEFARNSSFDEALAVLTRGAQVPDTQKLTIPEGFRADQIAKRIEEKLPGRTAANFNAVLAAKTIRSEFQPADAVSMEGVLFPDTYTFSLEDDETTIANRFVETFDQVAEEVGLDKSSGTVGLTPYETLIVASLIEREAKLDSDRAKISRVIYNRLKTDTALQIDATIIYGMGGGVDRVLNEDLKRDGPYNSYTRKGLPPTPIANPGKESLIAALNPEPGDWLYYVVTGADGSHSFAKTFREHRRNIAIAKERGLRD